MASECGVSGECGVMRRQGMWRRNAASAGNAASGRNVASGNVASECGVSRECGFRGKCGVRECGVTGFWNAASECEFSVRWKSTVPFAAALKKAAAVHFRLVGSLSIFAIETLLALRGTELPSWWGALQLS